MTTALVAFLLAVLTAVSLAGFAILRRPVARLSPTTKGVIVLGVAVTLAGMTILDFVTGRSAREIVLSGVATILAALTAVLVARRGTLALTVVAWIAVWPGTADARWKDRSDRRGFAEQHERVREARVFPGVSLDEALRRIEEARQLAEETLAKYDTMDNKQSCWMPCGRCGFWAVSLIVGGTAAIVAGCGSPAAGSSLGSSCVAGAFGWMGMAANVLDSCTSCGDCIEKNKEAPPDPTKPPSDEGDCPKDYHPCCGSWCCSDTNPPEKCPETE